MSQVTNVIFTFHISEEYEEIDDEYSYLNMKEINNWLEDNKYGAFGNADEISGGHKNLERPIFIAAFNHFDLDDFIKFICTLKWEEPSNVQLFICRQEDDKFQLIEPCKKLIKK